MFVRDDYFCGFGGRNDTCWKVGSEHVYSRTDEKKFWHGFKIQSRRQTVFSAPTPNLCAGVPGRFSCIRLFAAPWAIFPRLLCPWGFSRQESWRGWPCPPPGDLPDPGIEPTSLLTPTLASSFFTTSTTWEVPHNRTRDTGKTDVTFQTKLSSVSDLPYSTQWPHLEFANDWKQFPLNRTCWASSNKPHSEILGVCTKQKHQIFSCGCGQRDPMPVDIYGKKLVFTMGGLDWTKARGEAEGEAFHKPLSLSIHSFSFLSKAVQPWRFRGLNVQKKLPWILWLHAFSIVSESESRSVVSDSCQPLGILKIRILAWVAFPFSRGSSPPRDWTLAFCISCIGRGILYLLSHWGFPVLLQPYSNSDLFITNSKLFLFYHPQWSPKATQMTHLLTWRYPWQSFHWAKEKFFK